MKNVVFFLFALLSMVCISSCNKEEIVLQNSFEYDETLLSRTVSGFQWICPECHMINGDWRDSCTNPGCRGKYAPWHGEYLLTALRNMTNEIQLVTGGGNDPDLIELPGGLYPAFPPSPWYEEQEVVDCYERLRKANMYSSNEDFLEAFDYAWYRCVRVFYPISHTVATLNRQYSLFYSRLGKQYEGTIKGKGILEGTKCAIACFDVVY